MTPRSVGGLYPQKVAATIEDAATRNHGNLRKPRSEQCQLRTVQTYPEQGKYCRMINQHLVRSVESSLYYNAFIDMEESLEEVYEV